MKTLIFSNSNFVEYCGEVCDAEVTDPNKILNPVVNLKNVKKSRISKHLENKCLNNSLTL